MSIITYSHSAGESPLERLPAELLRKILIFVALNPTTEHSTQFSSKYQGCSVNTKPSEQATSLPCLLTSRTLHMTALPVMYRDITTTLPSTFTKFLGQIRCHPNLGKLVRSLELSPVVTRNPRPENEILANPLPGLLHLTHLLRHFKLSPTLQDHLTKPVLRQLLCELPHLESIDLSNCNSPSFAWEFGKLSASQSFVVSTSITTINVNGCEDLPPHVFDTILPQLPKLQSLEVAGTQITTAALSSIPRTARLTNLNLNNCASLSSKELTFFLRTHPSVKATLEVLDLGVSAENQYLFEEDVTSILTSLPPSVRILNLKHSNMATIHISHLRRLAAQLEEFTVGSQISMRDLEAVFLDPEELDNEDQEQQEEEEVVEPSPTESKYATILDPMEEAVAICKLRRRINSFSSSSSSSTAASRIRFLDISSMSVVEQGKIRLSVLLGPRSGMLERIEISENVVRRVGMLKRICRAVGWDLGSLGRKCWIGRRSPT